MQDAIDYQILSIIFAGRSDLGDILNGMLGLYDPQVLPVLWRLKRKGLIKETIAGQYCPAVDRGRFADLKAYSHDPRPIRALPPPHPVDYDWRFSLSTCRDLVSRLIDSSLVHRRVLLLGTPSVFVTMAALCNPPVTHLLDRNSILIERLNYSFGTPQLLASEGNCFSEDLLINESPFDCVLCDPPWYTDYYCAFLRVASRAVCVGGKVLLCLRPLNSTPESPRDRLRIIEEAAVNSLHVIEILPGAVSYDTAPFEKAAWSASETRVTDNWHHGDLVTLLKTEESPQQAFAIKDSDPPYEWHCAYVGAHKVALKGPISDKDEQPSLLQVLPATGDIMPCVKRILALPKQVDLWLSDNRVFSITGKRAFRAALEALADAVHPTLSSSTHSNYTMEAQAHIERLLLGVTYSETLKAG